jgi:hypothetical protein
VAAEEREMEVGLGPGRARRLDCGWVEVGLGEERERKDLERGEVEVAIGRERSRDARVSFSISRYNLYLLPTSCE